MQQRVISTVKFQWMLCLLVSLWLSLWSTTPLFAQATDETGRIAGIVTNEEGVPLAGIQVTPFHISDSGERNLVWQQQVLTDSAGSYQITDLEPGPYIVRFQDLEGIYAFEDYPEQLVVRSGQTTVDIDAALTLGGVITGYVSLYDGTPVGQSVSYIVGNNNHPNDIYHGSIGLLYDNGFEWEYIDGLAFESAEPRFDLATSTFRIEGLATGSYIIQYSAYHKGIPPLIRGGQIPYEGYFDRAEDSASATSVYVTAGVTLSSLHIVIGDTPTLGRIQGRAMDENGVPLAGIIVEAYRYEDEHHVYVARNVLTDSQGYYTLRELPAGDYAVRFSDHSGKYAFQFADQTELTSDAFIVLAPGQHLENVDATLQLGSSLTGKIFVNDGSSVTDLDMWIVLEHIDWRSKGSEIAAFSTQFPNPYYDINTNQYTVNGLAAGIYRFGVSGGTGHIIPVTVTVPSSTINSVDVTINTHADYGTVEGWVTDTDGKPISGIQISLRALQNGPLPYGDIRAQTDRDGYYRISNVIEDDYLIIFHDPLGNYAFQFFPNSADMSAAQWITVDPGAQITNIDAVLRMGGEIRGAITVYGSGSLSEKDVQTLSLLIESKDVFGATVQNRVFMRTYLQKADNNLWTGEYAIRGLARGEYGLCVSLRMSNVGEKYKILSSCYGAILNPQDTTNIEIQSSETITIDAVLRYDNQRVLALYALALDHDPDRIDNLAPQLAPAMQSIIAATRDQPNKTAVVLADAAGVGDTRIYVVQNGRATPVQGLPNAAFQLDPTLTEFNMADGETLGNFIRWARNTYLAEVTLFGFVGHGAPLVPATGFADIVAASGGIRPFGPTDLTTSLFPLPSRVDAYPSLTDNHPEALITPHDLATALRIGSNNGADPLQIADIAHCFSASIEELYELSPNGTQPYAEIILASPTYTYLDPPALGQALGAINTLMTPATMADQILRTYDSLIEQADLSDGDADVEHPRLLVAVNSRQVARVKADWDKVAYALLQNFDGEKLRQAYLASPKYDTTLCRPQDWALSPPDALSDLDGFAVALRQVYGAESAVGQAATTVIRDLEESAILSRYQRNGTPWYAPQNAQFWNFDQHKGIALYTDLQGMPTAKAATVELSWQSRWYTADTLGGENPHPYAFVQNGADGVTWADLFAEFWRRQPNVTIQTALCFPELASDPQTGALRAVVITSPVTDTMRVGLPFTPVAVVAVEQATLKPKVRFNLYDATQTLLFSDTVQAGYWLTGTHQIAATRAYTPTAPGSITVEVTVDPTNGFIESDESDNHLVHAYTVAAATNLFPLAITAQLAEPALFVSSDRVQLQAAITPVDLATTLEVQLYQFADNATNTPWQPVLRDGQLLDREHPELLLDGLSPGVVLLHIWARTADGSYSATPALVEFNYAPANQLLAAGQRHIYRLPPDRLPAPVNGATQLNLALSRGRADLFAWSPFNQWGPEWSISAPGDAPLILPATTSAEGYLLELYAITETQYTLTAQPTANPPTTVNAMDDDSHYRPAGKPFLIEPVSMAPGRGRLVAGRQFFVPLVSR